MRPTCPPPTKEYIAAQRAELTKPDVDVGRHGVLREQAPFWMLQAQIAYSVPDASKDCRLFNLNPIWRPPNNTNEYNTVSFYQTLKNLQQDMQPGSRLDGGFLAMGSFFYDCGNSVQKSRLDGRYFLTAVGSTDWTIPNEYTLVDPIFAPSGSFILAFAGTQPALPEFGEDFDWRPEEAPCDFYPVGYAGKKVWSYKSMLKAHKAMFDGVKNGDNPMKGVTEALETEMADGGAGFVPAGPGLPGSPNKEITIVGHSLGGAQAQIAAVHIALKYNAKVRVITYESIMAFTPETAKWIAEGSEGARPPDKLIWTDDDAMPTAFPDAGGKIAAQRWVENDSPLSAAPLLLPAGGPVCLACNLCCWPHKFNLVGCWPFNSKIGGGYLSKALVLSGFRAKLSAKSKQTAGGGPCAGCTGNGGPPYEDAEFEFHEAERTYVTKGASRLRFFTCFPPCVLCNSGIRSLSHLQPFLLWMLYKGAWQNADAPQNHYPPTSKYVPRVTKVDKPPQPS